MTVERGLLVGIVALLFVIAGTQLGLTRAVAELAELVRFIVHGSEPPDDPPRS